VSWLSRVYCRWPCARSLNATLQKDLMEHNGPDLLGCRGMGTEIGAGLSGTRTGPIFTETRLQ
jgi:hypothetical protein